MAYKKPTNYKKAIFNLLKSSPGVPQSRKNLSHALGVHKSDYKLFSKALNNLVNEGKVIHVKKNLYAYAQKAQRLRGEIRTTRSGFGFVNIENQEIEVFIAQPNLNTAFDRDIVEVQLYAASRGKRLEGFVSKIIQRFREVIVGTYHQTEFYSFVTPDDPKVYRDILIARDKTGGARDGQKVVVAFDRWERDQHNPEGHITEVLGDPDAPGVDIISVAYSFNLPVKFPGEVDQAAEKIPAKISKSEIDGRLDLRKLTCFTIDPADAKDFDDAVSLEKLDNGNQMLGVHIADVSHYVQEAHIVDKEAFRRGTSVYLVDRVIPMLPERLSNTLCSLKPEEDRLTFSCFMEMDGQCSVFNYRIVPSIINSNRRFTYEEVEDIVQDKKQDDLKVILKDMHALSKKLTEKRFRDGGIDFETPEVRFELDERGQPTNITPVKRLDSNRLVEEFMLAANQTVAKHIYNISPDKNRPLPFIYRVHEKPDEEKVEKLFTFLSALEVSFKPVKKITSKYIQQLLTSIKGSKEEFIIEEVALRSMMKAVYSENNIGHFGLGFKDYTHFTSPIRRYPDLIVHRLLKKYAASTQNIPNQLNRELQKIAKQSSSMERLAVEAERESIKLKQVEYINRYLGQTFKGLVSGVSAQGFWVELYETFVEGMVHITKLDDDFYIYDETTYSLIGRDTEKMIRLGDEVSIRVEQVDLERKQVDFSLIENFSDEPGRFSNKKLLQKHRSRPPKKRRRR